MSDDFWEDPEVVARFAARDVDHRVRAFTEGLANPAALRALDIGCAGGRNVVFLASLGADIHALDASEAMVAETRRRLEPVIGVDAATERVRVGAMDDLSGYGDGSFDLVIALGVYHEARSMDEWHRAVSETGRVLARPGRVLVAHFAPGTVMEEAPPLPVSGEPGVYETSRGRRRVLLDAEAIDRFAAMHGLVPLAPTETVEVDLDEGRKRVTVNAEYGKV